MKRIEAEKDELVLQNESGTYAIIPANRREEVKRLLSEGCYDCIDRIVESLPKASDYAQKGTTIDPIYYGGMSPTITVGAEAPNWLKFKREYEQSNSFDIEGYVNERFNNTRGRQAIDKINPEQFRQDLYNEAKLARNKELNTYVADKLLQQIPQNNQSRAEYLNQFIDKEQQIIKQVYPKYSPSLYDDTKRGLTSLVEKSPLDAFNNILNSKDYTDAEKRELLQDYIDHPVMSKLGDAAKILSPLTVPSKMVQSAYKDDYTMQDALQGRKNNAGIVEDIATDPLNLVGLGIWSRLKNTGRFSKIDDAYKAVQGLSKEKQLAKLNEIADLSKLENIFLEFNIEDLIKGISSTDRKNTTIIREGKQYFKELSNEESLKRLKEFGDEYDIDLIGAYKKAEERWDYGTNIGKHSRFHVAGDEVFKGNIADAMGVSTLDREGLMKSFFSKDKNLSSSQKDLSNNSINYINKKASIEDYHTIVWHELSHDINKNIIDASPKLQKEISDIFTDNVDNISEDVLKATKVKSNKLYKSDIKSINNTPEKNIKKSALDEIKYVTKPTETWAFLSTNLRQDLKNTGVIKDYNELLTLDKLNQAIKNENTVYSRFEPYIKDKKKFIELFNKMTLTTVPVLSYIQSKAANSNKSKIKAADGLVVEPPDLAGKLLDTIGQLESNNQYDVLYGGKRNPELLNMTIGQLLEYQNNLVNEQREKKKTNPKQLVGSAAGKYQFIPDTIRDFIDRGIISMDDKFDIETQDKMAIQILKESGLNKYLKGAKSAESFADSLSSRWASIPYSNDKSYYEGVGRNKSLMSRKDFMATVFGIQQPKEQPATKDEIDEMLSNETLMAELEAKFGNLDAIANIDFTNPVEAAQQLPEVSEADLNRIKTNLISNGSATKESLKYLPLQALVRTLRSRNVDKYQGIANNPILLKMVHNSLKQM